MLSGNRNFEGRINSEVRANYLMSPPLVVAFALAGRIDIDLRKDPIGKGKRRQAGLSRRHLAVAARSRGSDGSSRSRRKCSARATPKCFTGDERWRGLARSQGRNLCLGERFHLHPAALHTSTTWRCKPSPVEDIKGARVLAVLGDSVTTDHISPAGSIKKDGPAGKYLLEHGVKPADFNSYGSRRGNHEVMVRGTFANVRLRNKLVPTPKADSRATCPTARRCRSSTRRKNTSLKACRS